MSGSKGQGKPWFLYQMVAHFTMRTHGVNQAFHLLKAFGYIERVVNSDFFSEKDLVFIIRAQCEIVNHLIKNHGKGRSAAFIIIILIHPLASIEDGMSNHDTKGDCITPFVYIDSKRKSPRGDVLFPCSVAVIRSCAKGSD